MSSLRLSSSLILRLGLGAVILWFGLNEVMNVDQWTSWIPEWATALSGLTPQTLVYINGGFEIIAASLLVFGVYTRYVAALLFLHMLVIVFDIGLTSIGVRDFGLAAALLALVFEEKDPYALTS